jgi:hypothetical protein
MAIPENQLTTWANQGAIVTSKETYATVRNALQVTGSGYAGKSYDVFLQGSYGNDTNIFAESDVDVVIRLDSVFYYDIDPLPADQQGAFRAVHPAAAYTYSMFKTDVVKVLTDKFVGAVTADQKKAVLIAPYGNRRSTDVLIATQFRRYSRFWTHADQAHEPGICFFTSSGKRIANYPKQHSDNLTAKNQETNEWLKHLIRIFKNLRGKLTTDGNIADGIAPSYYVEGLLYNVPTTCFGNTYEDSMVKCLTWLRDADRSAFRCANGQYLLLDDDPDVSWTSANCTAFLAAAIDLWNGWG